MKPAVHRIHYLFAICIVLLVFMPACKTNKSIIHLYYSSPYGFTYIPSGDMGTEHFNPFWMSETEISNETYREFLKDLADSGRMDLYHAVFPDTNLIKKELWIGEKFGINYFTNAYFKDCPVVGITPLQAQEYCKWLNMKYKLKYPEYELPEFRLPTLSEWSYSAGCGKDIMFPWGFDQLRNSKGCLMATFNVLDDKYFTYDSIDRMKYKNFPYSNNYLAGVSSGIIKTDSFKTIHMLKKRDYIFYGMPLWCYSYFSNNWGLYNMSGNVAEMVIDGENKFRCVGGSYATPGAYLRLDLLLDHHAADSFPFPDVGFRVVMNYKKLTKYF